MAARDKSYDTPNYRQIGGSNWHVGGTLELGDLVTVTINAAGQAIWSGLPTADPHVVGMIWNSAGALTLSAG